MCSFCIKISIKGFFLKLKIKSLKKFSLKAQDEKGKRDGYH